MTILNFQTSIIIFGHCVPFAKSTQLYRDVMSTGMYRPQGHAQGLQVLGTAHHATVYIVDETT
jgi:hypothetical protein